MIVVKHIVFDEEEFKRQNPILVSAFDKEWIKS